VGDGISVSEGDSGEYVLSIEEEMQGSLTEKLEQSGLALRGQRGKP